MVSATGYLLPSSARPAPSASSIFPSTGRTAHSNSREELKTVSCTVYIKGWSLMKVPINLMLNSISHVALQVSDLQCQGDQDAAKGGGE